MRSARNVPSARSGQPARSDERSRGGQPLRHGESGRGAESGRSGRVALSRRAMFRDEASKRDAIHKSLLTGLLTNVGKKLETHEYQGPRSVKFNLFPGSALFKAKPQWIMAAEVVETTRLYARTVGPINPEWIEKIAPHLLSKAYSDPFWDSRGARAMVKMKLTYHGLTIVAARTIPFSHVDPVGARNLFIQHALVEGDYEGVGGQGTRRDREDRSQGRRNRRGGGGGNFLRHNLELLEEIKHLEDKARRRDLASDTARLFAFYNVRIPSDVTDGPSFERWRRDAERANPKLLMMTREDVLSGDASEITQARYPDELLVPGSNGLRLELRYRYEPGHPADGVTAMVPLETLAALNTWQFDRLIPGYLEEKIDAMIRTLPKNLRVNFVPVPQYTSAALPVVASSGGMLTEALGKHLGVPADQFNPTELPTHLHFNFRVLDQHGKVVAAGRDLVKLRAELGVKARSIFADLPPSEWNRDGLTRYDFETLPRKVDITINGTTLPAYPAIVDKGETVSLRLMEAPEIAYQATRQGLRRLFALQLREEMKYLEKSIPDFDRMSLMYRPFGTAQELKADLLTAASEKALVTEPEQLRTKQQFIDHAREGWRQIVPAVGEISKIAIAVLDSRHRIDQQLSRVWPELLLPSVRDVQEQLVNLMPKNFLSKTPEGWLPHLPRYMKAIEVRLGKLLNAGAARDIDNLKLIRPLWKQFADRAKAHATNGIRDPELATYRWMLEELRVSFFAQELKTSIPISPQRMEKQWEKVRPPR